MKKIIAAALFITLTGLAVLTFSQSSNRNTSKFKALKIYVKDKVVENKKVVMTDKALKKINDGKRQVRVSKNLKIKVLKQASE